MRRAGFTLLEILAVIAIFALLSAFVLPNLGAMRARQLEQAARRIADQLELARHRSIATGVPHRLLIDLDAASYRLEAYASEASDETATPGADLAPGPPGALERAKSAWDQEPTGFSGIPGNPVSRPRLRGPAGPRWGSQEPACGSAPPRRVLRGRVRP